MSDTTDNASQAQASKRPTLLSLFAQLGLTLIGVIVFFVVGMLVIGWVIVYFVGPRSPSAPEPPPQLSLEEAALPGTLHLLMQGGHPAGPNSGFLLVAFNPQIGRSRVLERLSEDEAFAKFGTDDRCIELYATANGEYRVIYDRQPRNSSNEYQVNILKDNAEILSLGGWKWGTVDEIHRGFYWDDLSEDHSFPLNVHYFSFDSGVQEKRLANAANVIVGLSPDTLYAFPSRARKPDDPDGVTLQRHNLQTRAMANVQQLDIYHVAGAGNISPEWGWLRARMSPKGGGYTAFIDLKSEKIIQQNIPESIFIKVVSRQ